MSTSSIQQEAVNALALLDEYEQKDVLDYIKSLVEFLDKSNES